MSIFRASFPAYVQRQINVRQDLVNLKARDSRFMLYTTGKNSWCRMTSFVNYDSPDGKLKGGELSRQYILESGTLFPKPGNTPSNQTGVYSLRRGVGSSAGSYSNQTFGNNPVDTKLGLRPMPGIVSVDIKSRGAYGSLREATIKFMAHSKAQLEDLEILFMRTGYSVLLEWGWSMYLDTYKENKGSANTPSANTMPLSSVQIKNFNSPTINPYAAGLDAHTLYRQIEFLREKFSGNYNGMYGLIKNFSWTLLENGSYECTTVLISVGDVLDSLKINSTSLPVGLSTDQQVKNMQTKFEALFSPLIALNSDFFINNVIGKALYQSYLLDPSNPSNSINVDFNIHTVHFANGPNNLGFNGQDGSLHYISFAAFIAAMSAQFNLFDPRKTQAIPLLDFELPYPGYGEFGDGLCLASEDSISIDPTICMIKNNHAQFVADSSKGFDVTEAAISFKGNVSTLSFYPFHYQQNKSFGIIGNIYLCIENLINTFKQLSLESNGYLSMHKFIDTILSQCSDALGAINDFGMFVYDSSTVIMDTHYMDPDAVKNNKFIINVTGTNTVIRNFNVQSKIFENQSTLVAIAAGVRENVSGIQSSTYNLLNRGLTDRIKVQSLEYDAIASLNAQTNASDPEGDYRKQLASMVINLRTYVQSYITDSVSKRDLSQVGGNKQAAISNLNSVLLKINTDTNYKAVLPISFEFTMDGIGGIVIGNVFRINNDALPREYVRKNLGLIVTSLSEKIEHSDWVITVGTMCCILEPDNVKGQINTLDKNAIEKEISTQQNAQAIKNALDTLKQIYIYNDMIKQILQILGAVNPIGLKQINSWLSNTNMFQPNSHQAVALYGLDTYIFAIQPPVSGFGLGAVNYDAAFNKINSVVINHHDFDNLNDDFTNRINEVLANVKSAIEQGTNNATATVPVLYSLNGTVNVFQNIFINTRIP